MTKTSALIHLFKNLEHISFRFSQKDIWKTIFSLLNHKTSIIHSLNTKTIHPEYAPIILR